MYEIVAPVVSFLIFFVPVLLEVQTENELSDGLTDAVQVRDGLLLVYSGAQLTKGGPSNTEDH